MFLIVIVIACWVQRFVRDYFGRGSGTLLLTNESNRVSDSVFHSMINCRLLCCDFGPAWIKRTKRRITVRYLQMTDLTDIDEGADVAGDGSRGHGIGRGRGNYNFGVNRAVELADFVSRRHSTDFA